MKAIMFLSETLMFVHDLAKYFQICAEYFITRDKNAFKGYCTVPNGMKIINLQMNSIVMNKTQNKYVII